MKKQFWIMVKQFLLYLSLDIIATAMMMIPLMVVAATKGYRGEDAVEYVFSSTTSGLCISIAGNIMTIAVFLKKRFVRFRPGRIARCNYGKAAGYAMLIAWGWMLTEGALLELFDIDKLFPEEKADFDEIYEMMSGPMGLLAGGILAPIAEEIGFRGILVGGLLRMRQKPWVAIVLPALVFGLYHGTYTQFVGTTVFGIICGWLYWRTKSLLPGILIHIVNNCTIFCIVAFSEDPNADLPTNLCLLFLVIFPPMLAIGLQWYKRERYKILLS